MKKTFLSLVFFILYSAFCFSSAPPDWEANTKKKYPDKDFILGFGEGKSREEARQNALVEVSESIVVLVEAETHGHSYKTQDDLKYTSNSSIAKDITTLTKNELFAVHYDWYPNKKEKYYVCAYINKKEVFEIVSSKLSSHEQNFLQKMGFIKAENDVLTKIIFLHEALSQENEIKLLHDYYKIIASEKKERFDELIKLVDESKTDLFYLKRKNPVSVVSRGDFSEQMQSIISKILTENGLIISKNADYQIIAESYFPIQVFNEIYSCSPTVSVFLEGKSGIISNCVMSSEQFSSWNKQLTKDRSLEDIEDLLHERLIQYLLK